jgi:rhodanese-related sulfurtransferase
MTPIKSLAADAAHAALEADPRAVLIDVRDPVEFSFVGHPVGAVNVPWKFAPEMRPNPEFLDQVSQIVADKATPLFLLCRSGQRSLAAANVLAEAGYTDLTNVEEGFEGPMDAAKHRSKMAGWRFLGLPWLQS